MLIIQSIRTIWSKQSRGGSAAQSRNATPELLPIPKSDHMPTRRNDLVQHIARFSEATGFSLKERVVFSALESTLKIGCLQLSIETDYVQVVYDHQWYCGGAPYRYRPVEIVTLEHSQGWAQIVYNGRHTPDTSISNMPSESLLGIPPVKSQKFYDPYSYWWYEKHVYNIALADKINPTLFTTTQPVKRHRSIARLR